MPLLPRRATGPRAWWLDVAVSLAAVGTAQALVMLGIDVLDGGRDARGGPGSEAALVLERAPGSGAAGDLLEPLGVTLEGSVSGLYPGARIELTLEVRNPSQVALRLDELVIAVGTPDRDGCTAEAILVGDALLIPLAAGGNSWGWVTGVNAATTPHEITVTTLAGAPDTTGAIFGARVAYLTTAPSPSALGLQWLGPDAAAAARLVGLSASRYMIDLSPGQEVRFEADTLSLYGLADNTGGPPLPQTPIFPQIPDAIGANGGRLLLGGSVYCVQRAVLTVEAQQVASRCHSATSGRSAHLRAGPTMTLEVDILVDDDHADQPDPGYKPGLLQLDVSTTPGRAVSLIMRVPVLQEMGEPVDLDGIHGRRLVYQSGPVVSAGTSYARAPGALAWG
jgi:hypothetical protein